MCVFVIISFCKNCSYDSILTLAIAYKLERDYHDKDGRRGLMVSTDCHSSHIPGDGRRPHSGCGPRTEAPLPETHKNAIKPKTQNDETTIYSQGGWAGKKESEKAEKSLVLCCRKVSC